MGLIQFRASEPGVGVGTGEEGFWMESGPA